MTTLKSIFRNPKAAALAKRTADMELHGAEEGSADLVQRNVLGWELVLHVAGSEVNYWRRWLARQPGLMSYVTLPWNPR